MIEIISDAERIARIKKWVRDETEKEFPFRRFFPSGAAEKPANSPVAVISSNGSISTTLIASSNENGEIKIEKISPVEKPKNKRLGKAVKMKTKKGNMVVSIHNIRR